MRGINFDQLRTFLEVIERASFSAAGDHLGLSQPAVSQQIRLLEKRLGVRLIERVGRKARPTSAGAILLSYARMILDAMASVETEMAPHVRGSMGRVRIGTGATASIYFLPTVLRTLRRRFDGLEIFVTTGTVTDVLRQVEDNVLDLGLVTLPAPVECSTSPRSSKMSSSSCPRLTDRLFLASRQPKSCPASPLSCMSQALRCAALSTIGFPLRATL